MLLKLKQGVWLRPSAGMVTGAGGGPGMIDVLGPPKGALQVFLGLVGELGCDVGQIRQLIQWSIDHRNGKAAPTPLEQRWYRALEGGAPDYDIYSGEDYLADLWACWVLYSRMYLRTVETQTQACLGGRTILQDLGDVSSVVDLGCGFGGSTAALRVLFPRASVFGTNLGETVQMRLARRLADRFGFTLCRDASEVGRSPVGLVFASEYFEHFQAPLEHLEQVVRTLCPRVMLVANTFTSRGAGHFDAYCIDGRLVPGRQATTAFSAKMRDYGYVMRPTRTWNHRPAYWVWTAAVAA